MAAFKDLASGTRKGRATNIRDGYFKYPAGSYLVFYRYSDAGIDIIRILHQKMDVSRHL